MIIAIHQPNFFPWVGYFYKMSKADKFVLLDDVQYTKNSFINRNRIKTVNGEQWLTMPVLHSGKFGQLINEVELQFFEKNLKKIRSALLTNYAKAPYFQDVIRIFDGFEPVSCSLAELNEYFIREVAAYLGIDTPIYKSSMLPGVKGESTERLIQICQGLEGDQYLAGFGSKKYQDDDLFVAAGMKTLVYDFEHPVYPQLWGDFIPSLSILDYLFNTGPEGRAFFNQ